MARDADIAAGLGQMLGLADLRYHSEQLAWAAVADAEDCSAELHAAELAEYRAMGLID